MAKPFIKNNKFIVMMSTNRRFHIVFDSKKKNAEQLNLKPDSLEFFVFRLNVSGKHFNKSNQFTIIFWSKFRRVFKRNGHEIG
jgi:hypothetical protein